MSEPVSTLVWSWTLLAVVISAVVILAAWIDHERQARRWH